MSEEKINLTIKVNKQIFDRVNDVVNYRNLALKFENQIEFEVGNVDDFIIGAVKEALNEAELFSYNPSKPELQNQDRRPIKNSIKFYLQKHKIKQIELSQATGIERGNLSSILNNNITPSLDAFLRIWGALGFPPINEIIYREEIEDD